VVSETRRIRSIYLPSPTGRPPGLSTTTPLQGRASPYTINGATMRPCRGDPPAVAHSIAAGSRSHPNPAGAGGRAVYEANRIRSHCLPLLTGRLPGFCPPFRYNANPHSILSMPRSRHGVTTLSNRPPCHVDACPSGGQCPPYILIAAGSRSHRKRVLPHGSRSHRGKGLPHGSRSHLLIPGNHHRSSRSSMGLEISTSAPFASSSAASRKPHRAPTGNIPAETAVRISVPESPR